MVVKKKSKPVTRPEKKGKHPGGRPSKLTPEVQETIVAALRRGNYVGVACTLADISEPTFYAWVNLAEGEDETGVHYQFLKAVKRACAEAEDEAVQLVRAGSLGWQASMTYLERRYRERWSRASSEAGTER